MYQCIRTFVFVPLALTVLVSPACGQNSETKSDGSVLPFPPTPSASVAGPTLQQSRHRRRVEPERLPKDAPNILIILIDDVGFGIPDTFGGPVHTPTLSRLAAQGISYNRFHTTSICSPTRAALLTGRNHHRAGSGTIAERASDWDGYVGVIPRTTATLPTILRHYGYSTSAFGKWHNSPADQTTAMGPFDRWPTGHGFDYFYGFVAGETSQYEPRLVENRTPIEPEGEDYHLTEDMAQQAIRWLRQHRAFAPDKPFLMYWAPGAVHGPHQVFPSWAEKYKGQFDDGWDVLRERTFAKQKKLNWIPDDAELTPRDQTMPAWSDIPQSQRQFQIRLMELFAGFVEHTDTQVGKLIDELERQEALENTLVFYIWGDNGSSAEGQNGSISELLAQNQIPNTIAQQLDALDELGGLSALGGPHTDSMYHAGWAWAGSTPFRHTKLVASHFGGTRNPMVVSWPAGFPSDSRPRSQFHHVNDIAPTVYDVLGITPPEVVSGTQQVPMDGVSLAYTFKSSEAEDRKKTQYFENNGSRGIYHDGWMACTFGPLIPWVPGGNSKLGQWDANEDRWELYDLTTDFSQMHDVAERHPKKLSELKALFLKEAEANKVFPIGGGLLTRIDPATRIKTKYTSWKFDSSTTRMPEFTAPGLGRENNQVRIQLTVPENADGVLYALGGSGGGLSLYMDKGHLVYEYNMMIIERYIARSKSPIAAGEHVIEVSTKLTAARPGSPADIILSVDGQEVARTRARLTVPAAFSASETFDVGVDLGSPVARDYFDRKPFRFTGDIESVEVKVAPDRS